MNTIILGSRGSRLALQQTREVIDKLKMIDPNRNYQIKVIKTTGDQVLETSLVKLGKGVFVREMEEALYQGNIHLAVHSLKDLPTSSPPGLVLGAITRRIDPRDVLLAPSNLALDRLPPGAVIGTSSLRRQALVKHLRPDLDCVPIRGNVNTRLAKLDRGQVDGLVVAAAGLLRLGLEDRITQCLSLRAFLPAAGQGALAVQALEGQGELLELIRQLGHYPTAKATAAERSFLAAIEGGCQAPAGAYARYNGGQLTLHGFIAHPLGGKIVRGERTGGAQEAEGLGQALAQDLLDQGGREILAQLNRGGGNNG